MFSKRFSGTDIGTRLILAEGVRTMIRILVALCITALLLVQRVNADDMTTPIKLEISKACGADYFARSHELFLEADGAETAADHEKETSNAKELIELANTCLANLDESSEDARLWAHTDVLGGLSYRLASLDSSDKDTFSLLLTQIAYQLKQVCELDALSDSTPAAKRARLAAKGEFNRLAKLNSFNVDLSTSPYGPYLDQLRTCAPKTGFDGSF